MCSAGAGGGEVSVVAALPGAVAVTGAAGATTEGGGGDRERGWRSQVSIAGPR